ncbi:mRNA-decapping enzyme 1B [Podospora conica]|nr:mRNA-decapping enzyme 1B [Schizothecium conicum]
MSKQNPRKRGGGQRNNSSYSGNGGPSNHRNVPASDYESDAAQYTESRGATVATAPPVAPLDSNINMELNMRVLRRYLPGIRAILSIAANAVVYTFSPTTQNWDKHGVEGTMFVCEQEPIVTPSGQALPRQCVFVLNRRGLDNLVLDLVRVSDCELTGELITFQLGGGEGYASGDGGGVDDNDIIGIWIHADEDTTRELNTTIIRGAWAQARLAMETLKEVAEAEQAAADQTDADEGGAPAGEGFGMPTGRRLSITDLFGKRKAGGPTAQQIVDTYIKALREYNDTKDVAQQLIGLVAENRGVPVSRIYEDEEYGVTSKD